MGEIREDLARKLCCGQLGAITWELLSEVTRTIYREQADVCLAHLQSMMERAGRALTCIFCDTSYLSLTSLKAHCGMCPEHPAVKEVEVLRGQITAQSDQRARHCEDGERARRAWCPQVKEGAD